MGVTRLLRQPFSQPPVPTADLTGQTVIVTGANVGLGKESVKHFVNRGAAKVIATCRTTTKGDAALAEIEGETKRPGIATFWELDYGSYASVKAFCAKVAELDRVDKVILNAGVATRIYEQFEGEESSITVNAISTTLLALLLLPTLQRSATQYEIVPTLSVTSSEIHAWAKFPERSHPEILRSLSDPKTATMSERYEISLLCVANQHPTGRLTFLIPLFVSLYRYPVSKLLQVFAVREIARRTASSTPFVIVNMISPGLNKTTLTRYSTGVEAAVMKTINALLAWEPNVGARTLFHGTVAGKESHGVLIDYCKLEK